jgi:hypothetical protein
MKSGGGAKGARAASKMAKTSPREATALPRWAIIFLVIFLCLNFLPLKFIVFADLIILYLQS